MRRSQRGHIARQQTLFADPVRAVTRAIVTHGETDVLVHYACAMRIKKRALSTLGYEEDEAE